MRYIALLLSLIVLFSCDESEAPNDRMLPDAVGSYSKIVVIAEDQVWNSGVKDLLEGSLSKEIEGLYVPEQEFGITYIQPKSFNRLFKKQRYILLIAISKKVKEISVSHTEDAFANGQKYVQIKGNSAAQIRTYLETNGSIIFQAFDDFRTELIQNLAKNENNQELELKLKNYHGISVTIPKSYKLGKDTAGFAYFFKSGNQGCEYGTQPTCYYQHGIMVYHYSYEDKETFTSEYLTAMRDTLTKKYIEGSATDDSVKAYMEVEKKFPVTLEEISLDGKYAMEMKGWWNMKNGTMGGPFVSVTIVDETRNRVITADAFTFCPNIDKRKFIKELEALCLSVQSL